jgi:hypothetical protein
MSRNAMNECIDAVNEREDQMRAHRQEYLESIGSQGTARRTVSLMEENIRLRDAVKELLIALLITTKAPFDMEAFVRQRDKAVTAAEAAMESE